MLNLAEKSAKPDERFVVVIAPDHTGGEDRERQWHWASDETWEAAAKGGGESGDEIRLG
jgi:hypothetical protein